MPTDRNYGSVNKLDPQTRAVWDQAFESAMRIYHDKKFSKASAWKAVRYLDGQEPRPSRSVHKMPNPGETIILGKLLEFAYYTNPPDIQFVKFRKGMEPDLLWSREHKMLMAFPHLSIPEQRAANVSPAMRQEYVRWSQRAPRGSAQLRVPAYQVQPAGAADTVVYRSSKWTNTPGDPEGAQEYIRQFSKNVVFEKGPGDLPSAIIFRGGTMDVLPAGIVN